MGFFGSIFRFFADIIKQILIKVISFLLIVVIVILVIKYVFKIDVLGMF